MSKTKTVKVSGQSLDEIRDNLKKMGAPDVVINSILEDIKEEQEGGGLEEREAELDMMTAPVGWFSAFFNLGKEISFGRKAIKLTYNSLKGVSVFKSKTERRLEELEEEVREIRNFYRVDAKRAAIAEEEGEGWLPDEDSQDPDPTTT